MDHKEHDFALQARPAGRLSAFLIPVTIGPADDLCVTENGLRQFEAHLMVAEVGPCFARVPYPSDHAGVARRCRYVIVATSDCEIKAYHCLGLLSLVL